MSADNWAVCPVCLKKAVEAQKRLKKEVDAAYGVTTQEKYLELLEKSKDEVVVDETMRETYWGKIGEDFKFTVFYKATCDRCGYNFEYKNSGDAPTTEG